LEGAESSVSEQAREAVLGTDQAEAENSADVIREAEQVEAAEQGTEPSSEAEAAIEDVPPADEAEVETLEDAPAEAIEQDALSEEEPLLERIETEHATADEDESEAGGA